MRNFITGILLLASIYWVWQWQGAERFAASQADRSLESIDPGAFLKTASLGFDSAPKARPFVATEQEEVKAETVSYPGMSPVEAAQTYLEAHRLEWNIQMHHDYKPVAVTSPLGTSVRFQFSQDGIPLTGMYVSIDMGAGNEIKQVENLYRPMEMADLKAELLSPEEVTSKLSDRFQTAPDTDANMLLFAGTHNLQPEPVYSISTTEISNDGQTRRPAKILVRAKDGQVLDVTYERAERTE
jgi:hypothetical protein